MNVSQEELKQGHSQKEIMDARLVYGFLMDSMTGYVIAEFRMQQAKSSSGAWRELENYFMPPTLAATHRLKREFEAIHMGEGEGPLVFLGRVDKAADELAILGCGKSKQTHSKQPFITVHYTEQINSLPPFNPSFRNRRDNSRRICCLLYTSDAADE